MFFSGKKYVIITKIRKQFSSSYYKHCVLCSMMRLREIIKINKIEIKLMLKKNFNFNKIKSKIEVKAELEL